MSTLYVDRKQSEILTEGGRIRILNGGEQNSIPWLLVDRIVIAAKAQLDSSFLLEAAERRIPVLLVNPRAHEAFAQVIGAESPDCERRLKQFASYRDSIWRFSFCQSLIRLKVQAQYRTLQRIAGERNDLRFGARKAQQHLRECLKSVRRMPFGSIGPLLGKEGAAARAYFEIFQQAFPLSFGFQGRNRRPPRDPINALLSLGYTIEHGQCLQALRESGLDASLGFLHAPAHGRQSLACDLAELGRAGMDLLVWDLVRSREIRIEDFQNLSGRCVLRKAGRARFYEAVERQNVTAKRRRKKWSALLARLIEGRTLDHASEDSYEEDALL